MMHEEIRLPPLPQYEPEDADAFWLSEMQAYALAAVKSDREARESMRGHLAEAFDWQIRDSVKCLKCGHEMEPGIAIVCGVTGVEDFPNVICTVSADPTKPKLIDCLKCPGCGWSVS